MGVNRTLRIARLPSARDLWRALLDADQDRFKVRRDPEATDSERLKAELRAEVARTRFTEALDAA